MPYYNTTSEKQPKLELFRQKAKSQQDKVLEFLKANPNKSYSANKIKHEVFGNGILLTSVRRSLSTLCLPDETGQPLAIKTSEKELGEWGRHSYKYQYNFNR